MKIVYEEQFKISLKDITLYIARDKNFASENFKKELKKRIEMIIDNPEMYRPSKYYPHKSYRDLIFKGYTTIYKINRVENMIQVLDIFKWVNR